MITFRSPFSSIEKITIPNLFKAINLGKYPKINDDSYSSTLINLIDGMLQVKPEKRIDLDSVLNI